MHDASVRMLPIHERLSSVLIVCWSLGLGLGLWSGNPLRAAPGDSTSTEERSPGRVDPTRAALQRLLEQERGRWYLEAFDLIPGSALLWAGSRRLSRHRRRGRASAGSWDFPWFGLYFTLTGAGTVATSLYLTIDTWVSNPDVTYPERLLEEGVSRRARRLYLRHRAEVARRTRIASAINTMASNGLGGLYVLLLPTTTESQRLEHRITGAATLGAGLGIGLYKLLTRRLAETLYDDLPKQRESRSETSRRDLAIRALPMWSLGPRSEHATWGLSLRMIW